MIGSKERATLTRQKNNMNKKERVLFFRKVVFDLFYGHMRQRLLGDAPMIVAFFGYLAKTFVAMLRITHCLKIIYVYPQPIRC